MIVYNLIDDNNLSTSYNFINSGSFLLLRLYFLYQFLITIIIFNSLFQVILLLNMSDLFHKFTFFLIVIHLQLFPEDKPYAFPY